MSRSPIRSAGGGVIQRMKRGATASNGTPVAGGTEPPRLPTAKRSVTYIMTGDLLTTVLFVISGVILGRLVEPSTLGLFNGIGLVVTYASFLGLGVVTGLARELPLSVGKGDRSRAEEFASAAQAWSLVVGGLVFVALVGVAGWQLAQGELWEAAGWFANAIMALLWFYNDYLARTYRTAHDFGRLALRSVVVQAALLLLLVLVVPLDFYGLCIRMVLGGALGVALLFHGRPVKVGPRWNTSNLKHLLRIGLPIFVVGTMFTYWLVIDRTLVLKLGGTRMMGLYSIVIMSTGALSTIPGAVNQVLYPRMTQRFGGGQNLHELARGYAKPIAASAAAMVPVVLIGWWVVGPVTRLLIPQYADAVPAMQWALPICFVMCFESAYALFTIGRRQRMRLVGTVAGMAAYAGSLLWLIRGEVYLAAFSQAMVIGRTVCVLVSYALIYRIVDEGAGIPWPGGMS